MRYKGIKGKAWNAVAAAVKRRDGNRCYTCLRAGDGYSYDTGHYKPVALVGSNSKWSWHPLFIRRQCKFCNGMGQGMAKEFEAHLRRDIGDELVDEFEREYRKVNPVKNWDVVIAEFDAIATKPSK